MADFIRTNDVYTLASYLIGAVVLGVMAVASFRAREKDRNNLRKLEQQISKLPPRHDVRKGTGISE